MTIMDTSTQTLAERLRLSRLAAGLDQAQIADQLGVSRPTVSAWETGRTEPSATHFVLWASLVSQPLEWLAEGVWCARRDSNPQPSDWESRVKQDEPRCFVCGGPHDLDDCPRYGDLDDELEQLLAAECTDVAP